MAKEMKTSSKMAAVAAEAAEEKKEILVTLSTGAVVKVIPPKTRVLYRLYSENPEPKVPEVDIEIGGKHISQPNPDDPDYQQARAEHQRKLYEAYAKLLILTSVSIVSLPTSVVNFDQDTDWEEDLQAIGMSTVYINRKERWLEWFFYRIAPDQDDIIKLQEASAELQGVTEEQVNAVTEVTFPNNS